MYNYILTILTIFSIKMEKKIIINPNVLKNAARQGDVNLLYKVIDFLNHDQETERYFLLPAPILKENIVYTAEVVSKTEEEIKQDKLIKIREARNKLLNESDIEVTIDKWENYTQEKKDSWKEYRQLLRDFPQSVENLSLQDLNIKEWPAKPGVNKINSICQALQ